MTPNVETVANPACEVGESPLWDDRTQTLRWVDLLAGVVHSVDGEGRRTEVRAGQAVGSIGLTDTSDLVVAVRDGFARLNPADGTLQMIASVEADARDRRMNDGKCDPWGGFVAGTMVDDQSEATGTLYRLTADGEVVRGEAGFTCPNGLDWAPDGRHFYHADTPSGRIDVCTLDDADHLPIDRRPLVAVDGPGKPDGLTLDSDGCLWVALWGGGCVQRFTPDGRLDRVLELPVTQPSSCAFGGPDLGTLFVTTARHGLGAEQLADQPLAGAVFAVTGLAQGRPANRFPLAELHES